MKPRHRRGWASGVFSRRRARPEPDTDHGSPPPDETALPTLVIPPPRDSFQPTPKAPMAAVCNVVSRATVAPKVSVRAKNTSARAFMGRTAPSRLRSPVRYLPRPRPPSHMLFPLGAAHLRRPADDDRSPDLKPRPNPIAPSTHPSQPPASVPAPCPSARTPPPRTSTRSSRR